MKIQNLKFDGLCYSHEGHDPILLNADFQFPENSICAIQSEEGEGKSTVLQILAALELPKGGSYLINDVDVKEMTFEDFLPYRLKIGYSFDYGGLINNRSLRDNLLLPLQYHRLLKTKEAFARVDHLIKMFDFEKFAHERPAHVPGRMRKLTCLLRSFVHYPDLLVMDDPFVGLGNETAELFVQLLLDLRSQGFLSTVILASYDDKYLRQLRPQILHLSGGQLYHSLQEQEAKAGNL